MAVVVGRAETRNTVSDTTPRQPHGTGRYDIRVQGHLANRWAGHLDGMTLTRDSDGTTLISGEVIDQAALHGLLNQVRDLGLSLLSVTRAAQAASTPAPPGHAASKPPPEPPGSAPG
jgi:hypothetical protein